MECLVPEILGGKHVTIDVFSVYFERIMNTNNGYFRIEIIISAARRYDPPRKY